MMKDQHNESQLESLATLALLGLVFGLESKHEALEVFEAVPKRTRAASSLNAKSG